jgi:poly(hydroxyalkanoate) depolymerase family esterase
MNKVFSSAMQRALRLTRAQNLREATRAIQLALLGQRVSDGSVTDGSVTEESGRGLRAIGSAFAIPETAHKVEIIKKADAEFRSPARRPLGEVEDLLRRVDFPKFGRDSAPFARPGRAPSVPEGAAYLTRRFRSEEGARDYKVYVPRDARGRKPPLVVMLHGCTQNPDDFALGTGMNDLADEHGFIVAYPMQPASANQSGCWNWFNPTDQSRGVGEPSIIAGLTRSIMAEFDIDDDRVYVAGLSAGGAMAAIMGAAYPELYAATGVHSGPAYGFATDIVSAFAAMRGSPNFNQTGAKATVGKTVSGVRTIVFHGASDRTVHPSNAEAIFSQARVAFDGGAQVTQFDGAVRGRNYTRTVVADAEGVPYAEYWEVEGLGHAWSGGSPHGSHTDSLGPEASREMLRFFLEGAGIASPSEIVRAAFDSTN